MSAILSQFCRTWRPVTGATLGCWVVIGILLGVPGCSGTKESGKTENGENSMVLAPPADEDPPKLTITGGKEIEGGAEYDFGSTEIGEEFEHVFKIKNDDNETFSMTKGQPSCTTCTSFEVDDLMLDPGETATVTVKWKIKSANSEFRQYAPLTVDLRTGSSKTTEIKLYVKGQVVSRIQIQPGEKWEIGSMDEGKPLEFTGTITSAILDQFKIASAKSSDPMLSVSYVEMSPEKLKEKNLKSGYEVKCVLDPQVKAGDFEAKISLDVLTPTALTLNIDIHGKRTGPMEIFGSNWDSKRMLVRLGSFNSGNDFTHRLNLYTRGFDGDLAITKVTVPDPRFRVEIVPDPSFKGASSDHRRYDLFIKYKGSDRDAVYPLQKPLEAVIETNHPNLKTFNLKILSQGSLRD